MNPYIFLPFDWLNNILYYSIIPCIRLALLNLYYIVVRMCPIFLFSCPAHRNSDSLKHKSMGSADLFFYWPLTRIVTEVPLGTIQRPHCRPSCLSCAATSSVGHYHTTLLTDRRLFSCPAIRTSMSYSSTSQMDHDTYIHAYVKIQLPKILKLGLNLLARVFLGHWVWLQCYWCQQKEV